jgi:Sugar-transfer associated ATP-grasp
MKNGILKTRVPARNFDLAQALRVTAKLRGISQLRLAGEIIRLGRGRQRLNWKEYFLYGAHQPSLSVEQRAEFLGESVMWAMNQALTPRPDELAGLFVDKMLTDLVLTRCGIPVAGVRAVAVAKRTQVPYDVLPDVGSLEAFLADTPLPFFGKPAHGSRSIGAVSILGREASTLILGDGSQVEIADFAAEIIRAFPEGYIFQDLMIPHPDLARIVGPVIASVRVVTVRIETELEPLYAAMKMPGPGQMVDDIVSFINTMCGIDHRTGQIVRGQDACKLGGIEMALNQVTGAPLAGAVLPAWPDVVRLARSVHEIFPRQGLLGTDVAITEGGVKVIEVNSLPHHSFYQKCFARGFWNADIAPMMTEALAGFGHVKATRQLSFP